MKKQGLIMAAAILLVILSLCSCAAPAISQTADFTSSNDRLLLDIKAKYRDASLVVNATCIDSHIDDNGETCYYVELDEILAGVSASVGDIFHCPGGQMEIGVQYMLFLKTGEDVHYAEDTIGYELILPLNISGEEVAMNGGKVALQDLKDELLNISKTINVPVPVNYYSELADLVLAADEIFIGRVHNIPEFELRQFSMRSGGSIEKAQYDASIIKVESYGSIKGSLSYGDIIEVCYSPGLVSGMIDYKSLQPTNFSAAVANSLVENGIYVFFLVDGPDEKQEYYFSINPVQGYQRLIGEDLIPNEENIPLKPYSELTSFVQALRAEIAKANEQPENPELIIE